MADLHNSLKYSANLLKGFASFLGLDETAGGVERLGETLTPTIEAWQYPDFLRLVGQRRNSRVQYFAAPGALNYNFYGISNPAGSGVLVTIRRAFHMFAADAQDGMVLDSTFRGIAGITILTGGYPLDSRWYAPGTAPGMGWSGRAAIGHGSIQSPWPWVSAQVMDRTVKVWDVGQVIAPGYAWVLSNLTDNLAGYMGCEFDERAAYPRELSGRP